MAENYGALRAFNERGELNIPTQAAADYIAEHGQVTASQPQDESWLSSVLSMNQKLAPWQSNIRQGIYDIGHGLLYGASVGAENINRLIPGATWLGKQASDAMRYIGIDDRISEPKGIVAGVSSGIGQVLPGIIPAVKILKAAGYAPIVADLIGGAIGDFAVSSKKDAKGLAELSATVTSIFSAEKAPLVSKYINDFIQSDNASFEDFKSRLVAAVPGAVLTPVVGGLARSVMKLKNKFASDKLLDAGVATDDLLGSMKTRWSEGKSPIPMGMSIEDVSPKQATDLDPQGFFSPMSRAVDALPQNKGTGDQMRAMIAKGEGVKAEEMAWTGLDDFLAGKKSVTKAEIKEFTDANQVRIEEVEKTSSGKTDEPLSLTWDNPIVDESYDAYSHFFDDIEYYLETEDAGDIIEDVISRLMKANPERYPEIDPDGGSVHDILETNWANKLRDYFDRGSEEKAEGTVSGLGDILRRDVTDAIDGIAKDEYMVNPYVTVSDATGSYDIYGNDEVGFQITRQSDGARVNDAEIYSLEEAKVQAHIDAIDFGYIRGHFYEGDTLFSEWQLPGGENYREVLLTLPERTKFFARQYDEALMDLVNRATVKAKSDFIAQGVDAETAQKISKAMFATKQDRTHFSSAAKYLGEEDKMKQLDRAFREQQKQNPDFTGGHFTEPNVLAHIRLNDRTGPNGEKILFVEEIQSDWHQKGRKEGYKTGEQFTEPFQVIPHPASTEGVDLYMPTGFSPGNYILYEVRDANGEFIINVGSEVAENADQAVVVAQGRIRDKTAVRDYRVPDAPLKKTWEQTALRRVIRMAAEEGYDSVAWTTGKMQADRYNLSKQIDELLYYRRGRGENTGYRIVAMRDGQIAMQENGVSEARLSDLVGKDIAEKIVAGEGSGRSPGGAMGADHRALSGLDLQLGGEGMKGFYDKELVNYANKFGKKFDAKVGTVSLNGPRKPVQLRGAGMGWSSGDTEVHSLPITPKMRESVMKKGIPLFGAGGLAATAGMQEDSDGL